MRLMFSLAAAALLALPFMALGATTSKTVAYTTSYQETQPVPLGGKYAGRMTLTFNEDGTVSGRYRDEFAGPISQISGSVNGTHIWLSFGAKGHQFHGTIAKGGVITGTLGNWRGPEVYTFTAVPTTS